MVALGVLQGNGCWGVGRGGAQLGVANRATFVVDKDGKIANIEEGSVAIDTTGADTACSRLAHKSP